MPRRRAVAPGGGRLHGPASVIGGQAVRGWQRLISAGAVRVTRRGPPGGKPGRALALRSRCRQRSTWTRRRARPARMASRFAVVRAAGRLAVAAPARTEVMTARRAAVNEIWRGCTGWPARRPLRAGMATAAAARAVARASSTAITQAACSWRTRGGEPKRSIGPVDGPAPLMADLASFRQVSDDPPPVVGLRELAGGVGRMVVQVGDQAEQLGCVAVGHGDGVLDHPDGQRDPAAGDLRQVGAVREEVPGPAQRDAVPDPDQQVGAGLQHGLDPRHAGKLRSITHSRQGVNRYP